jgi:hypothetical protein
VRRADEQCGGSGVMLRGARYLALAVWLTCGPAAIAAVRRSGGQQSYSGSLR